MRRYLWKDRNVQKEFILKFCEARNIQLPQEWNKITSYNLRKAKGRQILYHYPNVYSAIETLFPEYQKYLRDNNNTQLTSKTYWESKENQKNFLTDLKKKFKFETTEQLLSVTKKEITEHGGNGLLSHYKGNYLEILKSNFPESQWPEFRHPLPHGFWKDVNSQRKYLTWLSKVLNHKSLDDWYTVTSKTLRSYGARGLLIDYTNLFEALQQIYPEHNWNIFKYKPIPSSYFQESTFRLQFFSYIEKELNIQNPNCWYKFSSNDIKKLGGDSFLNVYDGSLQKALQFFYPDVKWNTFKFRKPNYFWSKKENQKKFISYLLKEKQISLNDFDSITKISTDDIKELGGSGLLHYYPSILSLLENLIPSASSSSSSFEWKFNSRNKIPRNYWDDPKNVHFFMENECKIKFKIQNHEDWYRLSGAQMRMLPGGGNLINRFGSLYEILKVSHPQEKWDEEKLARRDKKSSQRLLFLHLQSIFPNYEIIEDFKHPAVKIDDESSIFELDIFIPKLKLAFEYQGKHHSIDTPSFGPLELNIDRDTRKLLFCKKQGIDLIYVHYHWDFTISSLKEKIPQIYLTQTLQKE